jgi:maleylacetate reductase
MAAGALGASDAPGGLFDLASGLGTPRALKDIGMPVDGLDRAATLATASSSANPRPVDYAAVRALLERAFNGVIGYA